MVKGNDSFLKAGLTVANTSPESRLVKIYHAAPNVSYKATQQNISSYCRTHSNRWFLYTKHAYADDKYGKKNVNEKKMYRMGHDSENTQFCRK